MKYLHGTRILSNIDLPLSDGQRRLTTVPLRRLSSAICGRLVSNPWRQPTLWNRWDRQEPDVSSGFEAENRNDIEDGNLIHHQWNLRTSWNKKGLGIRTQKKHIRNTEIDSLASHATGRHFRLRCALFFGLGRYFCCHPLCCGLGGHLIPGDMISTVLHTNWKIRIDQSGAMRWQYPLIISIRNWRGSTSFEASSLVLYV